MKANDFSHQQNLQKTAISLTKQGISVIPVHGNNYPRQPKKPAIQWGKSQKQIAELDEIASWFNQNITAIGIVCGRVSNLMVIDFDDHLTYTRFSNNFPKLSQTFTVKTQRGYHLYFQIDHYIPSHSFDGGDIKGERSYVIASPSIIDNYHYHITNLASPHHLSSQDVDTLLNYFQIKQQPLLVVSTKSLSKTTVLDLIQIYNNLSSQIGRNNALYRVASIARDHGISKISADKALITHHVMQPSPANHKPERPDERYQEATRTITSAYQKQRSQSTSATSIPNSIRETLLNEQNSTIVPRLLDIFRLSNWKPKKLFSITEAIELCKNYGLNRKSVLKALTGHLAEIDGNYIIVRRTVEYPDNRGLNSKAQGRPIETLFEVPSVDHLLKVLKIDWSPSDPITSKDVQNAHNYRLALHREFIRRLTPEVPMGWLAKRIGVHVRTIQRYNQELNVHITQNLGYFRLSRTNLDSLPKRRSNVEKNTTNGFWLETEDGRRYPAWRHIGSQLLKSHPKTTLVCVQKPSKLSLEDRNFTDSDVVWHEIKPYQFVKIQAFRNGFNERPKLNQAVNKLFNFVKRRLKRARYYSCQLHFDSVFSYIAKDDVAETITSYLYAYDEDGNRVHRPAKRGIAYRMLKEFGNGNVYLALRDSHTELWYSLARHAIRFDQLPIAMKFLLSALD